MNKNIYIYGGSFDPVHNSHLIISKTILEKDKDSKLVFTIAKSPRWKTPKETIKNRLDMLKIGLKAIGISNYDIDEYEINSKNDVNYTIDTLKHIIIKYGKDKNYYLVIGGDQVNKFHEWKDALEISRLSKIIYVKRKGIPLSLKNIRLFNMTRLNLEVDATSSTDIRELKSLDIPMEVFDYIEKNELYFIKKIKSFLIEKRYVHSLSVAKLCYEIAKNNNLDKPMDYFIAGLLHDIGKYVPKDKSDLIMNKYYKKYLYMHMSEKSYHQFLGEYIAKKEFGITNKTILGAIKYHCSGNEHMSKMAKIVYAADKIDPNRGYDSKYMIDACNKDFEKGFILVLSENIKHLESKGLDYNNRLTNSCIKCYLNK